MNSLTTAISTIDKLKQTYIDNSKAALQTAFKEIFDNFSEVEALRFTGYTPYFNDGDVCVYHLYDLEVKLSSPPKVDMTCTAYGCTNQVGLNDKHCAQCGKKQPSLHDRTQVWYDTYCLDDSPLKTAVKDLYNGLKKIEQTVKEIFGDHAQVVITKTSAGGINYTTTEYEHE